MKVVNLQEVDLEDVDEELLVNADPENGILGCKTYRYNELPEYVLADLFAVNPEFILSIRPDWVKANHPNVIN